MMRGKKLVIAALVAALLGGCSGAPSTSTLPAPGASGNALGAQPNGVRLDGRARVTLLVPRRHKHAHYISPNTKSIAITYKGKKIAVLNVTPGSAGCSSTSGGTLCEFVVNLPSGKVTLTVSAYGGANGAAPLLSSGSVTKTITPGVLAYIPLTLEGVVAAAAVTLGEANPPAGAATQTGVYVTAYDASGAAIIGPGNYTTPLVLTDSDATGTTLVSGTFVGPGGSGTLTYNGSPLLSASIGVSAGTAVITVTPASFAPLPSISASVALPMSISNYSPLAIANGPDGTLWYTATTNNPLYNSPNTAPSNGVIVVMTTGGGIINGFNSGAGGLTADNYSGIVEGPDGNMWFTETANNSIGEINTTTGTISQFSANGGAGTACPQRIITVPSDDAMWFTSNCPTGGGIIGRITTNGSVSTYSLSGGGHRMDGIVLGPPLYGSATYLYVVDRTNRAIGQVVVAGGVATAYTERLVGTNPIDGSNNSNMTGIVQTADKTLWWTNTGCPTSTIGSLVIGTPFTSSRVAQYTTAGGCGDPSYMALAPAGGQTIWVAESGSPFIEEVSAPTGGGPPALTDYTLQTAGPTGVGTAMYDIVLGADGNLWSTNPNGGGSILRLTF